MQENWKIRIASSLGDGFEGTPQNCWGVKGYFPEIEGHLDDPCVFFGLYGMKDFFALWSHRGPKYILWCGSDIRNFENGFWLDNKGDIHIDSKSIAHWINTYCKNYVENEVEQIALRRIGVKSIIVPSFLGDTKDFEVCFKARKRPSLYTSVSGNDFKVYGWEKIYNLARNNPDIDFFLYGNTIPFPVPAEFFNVFVRGRIPQEEMNKEIKEMTGALRLTEFDGFSEIIAKSLLWGQWPVSLINYPGTIRLEGISFLKDLKQTNLKGREWLLSVVNKYPWNQK